LKAKLKFYISLKAISGALVFFLFYSGLLSGQTYSFKNYGSEYKIPNGFINTLNQSDNGFLWVGTGNGIYRFDGYDYFPVQYPDGVLRIPTVSYKDRKGTLWFGFNDGTVFYSNVNSLIKLSIINSRSVSGIIEGTDGLIYIISQGENIFTVNPDNPEEIKQFEFPGDYIMFSAAFTASGKLLIGSEGTLLVCNAERDTITISSIIEGFEYSGVKSIQKTGDSDRFVIGTKDNGLFQLRISETGYELGRFKGYPEWSDLKVNSIISDRDDNIWVSTVESGVIQFKLIGNGEMPESVHLYNSNSGLSSNYVSLVFQDAEGNIWFGLFGVGDYLSMLSSDLASNAFGYFVPGKTNSENNIIFVDRINDNFILGTPTGFHIFDPIAGKSLSFTNLTQQVGNTLITVYHLDKDKNLWIGTDGKGLYVRTSSGEVRPYYRSGDTGADNIRDIEKDDRNIWLATTNGVIVIDIKSKATQKFDNSSGLPYNSINKIMLNSNGDAIIGTQSDRLFLIDNSFNVSPGSGSMSGSGLNKIISISRNKSGEIWVATSDNGIFRCINDSVSSVNTANGLLSNYCYSILADTEDNIWIGHTTGFSRIDPESGVVVVYGADYARGGVCNPNAMYESSDRKILIGTTEGLIIYDRIKDRKSEIPPFNNITSVLINDSLYQYRKTFHLPYNKYRIKITFTGISFRAPDKVDYSIYMENFDQAWSLPSPSRVETYNLQHGKYKFNMISKNEKGLSEELPVTFDISIESPWWIKWWSILSAIIIVAGTVIIIIREREKAQKKIQDYLEKELDARTSVVMKQKGEIELQNIEITDSINYAKRIQSSILPDISKLKESFKDAFILFHPRDIVSGDFYWFDKIDEDKFVLVCADSTGHGVPGAFMSMIGSTLLQDIVTRKKITKPSEILGLLDKQIFSTLNQNVELGVSNDGMDMVVCEFNIRNRHIRFASAMRPVIIVLDGEPFYIKGNRSSVGGESAIEKYFDDQEYYLHEGDTIYLFSDGLPDQFGGIDGKKMKIARLKRMIEQVSKLPMSEQKEAISKFYFEWKGTYDQVDDVLLMGIKV
jgi:ligand-binding sensor domain-containing protein/serine phosphatase RsbU (regulator of sigma subunit)